MIRFIWRTMSRGSLLFTCIAQPLERAYTYVPSVIFLRVLVFEVIEFLFLTFAKVEAAREREAYLAVARGDVAKLPDVKGVYLTFGEQDIVVIHEAPTLRESVQTAVKLRNIPGIIDTQTMVCMDIEEVFG